MVRQRWHELYDLITKNKFNKFVEVGVFKGETSAYLLKNIPDADFRVFAIDPYENYEGYVVKNINQIRDMAFDALRDPRCTMLETYSVKAAECFDDESIDIVFIDANHSYAKITEDILVWFPKVKKGGILSGHDYWSRHRNPWVKKAVNEFIAENKFSLHRGSDGVWWIKK